MRVQCPNCGGDHPKWDCKRPAKKSTAARKDVQKLEGSTTSGDGTKKRSGDTGNARFGDGLSEASKLAEITKSGPAGTQALPVDTNSSIVENEGLGTFTSKNDVADTSAGTVLDKDRQPKFDKVAYQRNYMRTYRAKKKEAEK